MFGSIVSSPRASLSPTQALELAKAYLENATNAIDPDIALVFCHDTEVSLSQARKTVKHAKDQNVTQRIAFAYIDLGRFLEKCGHEKAAQVSYKKAEKLGVNAQDPGRLVQTSRPTSIAPSFKEMLPTRSSTPSNSAPLPLATRQDQKVVTIAAQIFVENIRPPTIKFKLPEADERLNNTPHLAFCLGLLQVSRSSEDIVDPKALQWVQALEKDTDEQERLQTMATEIVRAFKRDELKDAKAIAEVVYLAPVLNKDLFQDLVRDFYTGIDHSGLLNVHQLEGLAQLIQGADSYYLDADDLVKVLELLSTRLQGTHHQSSLHVYQLTLAVSHVLDAMADAQVKDLDREKLHEPLLSYLGGLKGSDDPYLVYQAAYAFQALLCVPDNETTWQAAMRRTKKVVQGVSGLVSAVKGLDLNRFIEGLEDIQKGFDGVSAVVEVVKTAVDGVASVAQEGKGFFDCLQEGLSFNRKRDWYSALRGADVLIKDGELSTLKELVCKAPCRFDAAFQWGICQRLGEIAINSTWDAVSRRSAIAFLGEMYRNDEMWGRQPSVKKWILSLLKQLASPSGSGVQLHTTVSENLLRDLESCGDDKKQTLYQECREKEFTTSTSYPLNAHQPELASPSLLDRVQNRPDVEGNIRLLRKQRASDRGTTVYIPPQAKSSLQAADDTRFPLMERVKEFLDSNQKVFLILGDSGSGKSMFNREFECELWQAYKSKTGRIPLHINLPSIDKPEYDMIAKQLRKHEFTEAQIREMKHYRQFILICDGYDESQQTHNLYMSNRLNQKEGWNAQMIISCRSEYIGNDYRDRFQPGDRNQQSDASSFQEAVLTPFSINQVHDYITKYVSIQQPLWQVKDYKQALDLTPSLKELVKNPFLMTLSLEVLPRMVDPGQNLTVSQVTRVALYDHFVEQWLERGKKRLSEKALSPQARASFESLSDEGFTLNGIEYLKTLAVAIYKEQAGHPIVEYSRLVDEKSWKAEFFGREDKHLLREACPLTRNGNQHRFIHRSLLEYGLARAVFDPDRRNRAVDRQSPSRRGSVDSLLSIEMEDTSGEQDPSLQQALDINSPLVWRSFVNDLSLMQFLEERVQQESLFKQQLFLYIERSKTDRKWHKAAANAITILVRAGVQFNGTDLRGIRIPRADLSYGVFDSVQLQGADLRKVNLQGVWLRQTDLSGSQLAGARFGELPYLKQDSAVQSCAYSPDGKSLAVGLRDGKIKVYSTSSWEQVRTLDEHTERITRVTYSPNGDMLASASFDDTVRLWDMKTEECRHVLTGHGGDVNWIDYSPQGDILVSGNDDRKVRLWDVTTGECTHALSGHTSFVMSVSHSPNSRHVASCGQDGTIRLWDIDTGSCITTISGAGTNFWAVVFSPQGDRLASSNSNKRTVQIWDVETGACLVVLSGHSDYVPSIAYSPTGHQIATGGMDNILRLWDTETGNCLHTMTGHRNVVYAVTFSPNGDQLASGSGDMTVRLWDISTGASRHISNCHSGAVICMAYNPKEDQLASGSMDGTIRLWDMETGYFRHVLLGHKNTVSGIAYSPQGDRIVSVSFDKSIRMWDTTLGECQHTLTDHIDWIYSVVFSPQGNSIASGSKDGTVRIWDGVTGTNNKTFQVDTSIRSIVYSPDGSQLTACHDRKIRTWIVETWECIRTLEGHHDSVRSTVYSPQGDKLASGSFDNTVRVWDVGTGECQMILIGHTKPVMCVAYTAKGDLIASGSLDMTVRLWDVETGQSRVVIQNFPGEVRSILCSPGLDSTYLVTGCVDGSIHKWRLIQEEDQCRVELCWCVTNDSLTTTGASIQDVQGLSPINTRLLKQRGAIGDPVHILRDASNKLVSMASVLSKLKQPANRVVQGSHPSTAMPLMKASEQLEHVDKQEQCNIPEREHDAPGEPGQQESTEQPDRTKDQDQQEDSTQTGRHDVP